jgi:hypothetical protein
MKIGRKTSSSISKQRRERTAQISTLIDFNTLQFSNTRGQAFERAVIVSRLMRPLFLTQPPQKGKLNLSSNQKCMQLISAKANARRLSYSIAIRLMKLGQEIQTGSKVSLFVEQRGEIMITISIKM